MFSAAFRLVRISYRLFSVTVVITTGAWGLALHVIAIELLRRILRVRRRPKGGVSQMPNHDEWVERYRTIDYQKTKCFITARMMARFGPVLDAIEGVTEFTEEQRQYIKAAVEHIRNEAMTRPSGRLSARQAGIWDAALDFFPDHVKLADSLEKDKGVRGLKPDVAQEQALKVLLHSHIDARRREIRGMTEHEHRICSKIWSIRKVLIQEVLQKNGRLPFAGYQCSRELAHEIRLRIRRDMPGDPLIGTLKVATIKGYLDFCCDECRELASQDFPRSQGDDVRARQLQRLERCIEHLKEPEKSALRAWLEDGGAKYCKHQGLEMAEFQQLLRSAKRHLRQCLDSEE